MKLLIAACMLLLVGCIETPDKSKCRDSAARIRLDTTSVSCDPGAKIEIMESFIICRCVNHDSESVDMQAVQDMSQALPDLTHSKIWR